MKDELLEQILALIEDPIPLLNSPEDERLAWETALFDLAELLESHRIGPVVRTEYGCHCDLEPGMKPDGCVLDDGKPEHCVYARMLLKDGKGKTQCEYWRMIEVNGNGKENEG